MNSKYKEKISEIFDKYQYEFPDEKTLDKVHLDVISYLYENGYNDDYSSKSFKPLVPNANYRVSIEDIDKIPHLQLELWDKGKCWVFSSDNKQ